MPLKILAPDEIAKAKSEERTREITEGLKISRKVDELRKLKAKEEQELELYRINSVRAMEEEFSALTSKKRDLLEELVQLQKKVDSLLPGIAFEREEIKKQKDALEKREVDLVKRENESSLKLVDISLALKKAEDTLARNRSNEQVSAFNLAAAQRKLENAKEIAKTAQENATLSRQEMQRKESNIASRLAELSRKEKLMEQREELNAAKEDELKHMEILLADQRKTLERAMQRVRQGATA